MRRSSCETRLGADLSNHGATSRKTSEKSCSSYARSSRSSAAAWSPRPRLTRPARSKARIVALHPLQLLHALRALAFAR